MRKSILRDFVILLVAFGFIWGIISLFPVFPEKIELLSIENEQEIGDAYLDMVLKTSEFKVSESEFADSIINIVGKRLEAALDDSEYEYNYLLVEDEMINAFTLPGGNIIVTSGLMHFCDSAEELAAVMAHEMGHSEMRHVVSRLVKEFGLAILTSGDQFVMGEITRMLTSAGFDRGQEEDADHFACELLEKAKIEPRTLASFFRKLKEEQGNDLLQKFEIVSTHPNFSSRIRETLEYIPSESFDPVPIEIDWDRVQAKLEAQ